MPGDYVNRVPEMTVDDFVAGRVRPEYRDIVAELRRMMRELAPGSREVIS